MNHAMTSAAMFSKYAAGTTLLLAKLTGRNPLSAQS